MRVISGAGRMRIRVMLLAAALMPGAVVGAGTVRQDESLKAGREAYEASEYAKAAQLLQQAAAQNPRSGEIHLLLAKTYYEWQQHDAAIASAERAVAIDPSSSVYHEWLGKVYGEKADHAAMFSALSLARKARREFAKAVELDETNFSAQQALIEFDCSAPSIAGGGEDTAQAEFDKALENHPQSADLIYDIGDYGVKHSQPERLVTVADAGEAVVPGDLRGKYYRAVAMVLKKERLEEAETLLREYVEKA